MIQDKVIVRMLIIITILKEIVICSYDLLRIIPIDYYFLASNYCNNMRSEVGGRSRGKERPLIN